MEIQLARDPRPHPGGVSRCPGQDSVGDRAPRKIYCQRANNGALDYGEQLTESSRKLLLSLVLGRAAGRRLPTRLRIFGRREGECAILRCRETSNDGFNPPCIETDRTQDGPDRIVAVSPR